MINTRSQRKTLNKGSYIGKPGKVIITSKNTRMMNVKHLEYYTLSFYIDCDEAEEDNMNLYDFYLYDDWKDKKPLNEYSYFKMYNILEFSKTRVFTLDKKSWEIYTKNKMRHTPPKRKNSIMRERILIKGLIKGG